MAGSVVAQAQRGIMLRLHHSASCSHGPVGRLCNNDKQFPRRPATGRWLVSWQLGRCAAKQSGYEILPVADADQVSRSRCSWIGSRAVISKLEQLLERPGLRPFYRTHSLASSHLQAGVN